MSQSNKNIIKLDNGLTVVLLPMSNTNQKLNVTFVFNGVGSGIDGGKPGISHLAEHMVFRGTETYTAKIIADKITNLSNSYTAYTAYDKTVFSIDTYKNSLNDAIELLVDMFSKSRLDGFDTEKNVIKHELNMRLDNPFVGLFSLIDLGYRLENNDVLQKTNLPKLLQSDVEKFIKDNYVPNKCQLIISGDIDNTDILEAVIKSKTKLCENSKTPQKEWKALDYKSGCFTGKNLTHSSYFALFFNGPKSDNIKDIVSGCIVNAICGSSLNSTLMYDARINQGLTYGIDTFSTIQKDHGTWGVISFTDKESLPNLLKSAMTSIKSIKYSINDSKSNNVDIAKIALKNSLNQPLFTPGAATSEYMLYNHLGVTKDQLITIIDETTSKDVLGWFERTLASAPSLALYGDIDPNSYSQDFVNSMWHGIGVTA